MKLFNKSVFKRLLGMSVAFCLSLSVLAACGGKSSPATYTYTQYLTSNPTSWSPFSYDDEGMITNYLTDPLLTFSLKNGGGYEVTPSLASALPTDVTASYKGRSGVPSTASNGDGYAWRFNLNSNAKWEDGTPITSDTFIYSLTQLLDRQIENDRAVELTTGQASIYGAYSYMYSDTVYFVPAITDDLMEYTNDYVPNTSLYAGWNMPMPNILVRFFYDSLGHHLKTWDDLYDIMPDAFMINDPQNNGTIIDLHAKWQEVFDIDELEGLFYIFTEISGGQHVLEQYQSTFSDRTEEYVADLVELVQKWLMEAESGDDSGYYLGWSEALNTYSGYGNWVDNILNDACVTPIDSTGNESLPWIYEIFIGVAKYEPEFSWANVGFKKINTTTFEVIFANPIKSLNDLTYYFASRPILVHEATFEASKIMPDKEGGTIHTKYGTDVTNTMSYGPYSLKSVKSGESAKLAKNANWQGYTNTVYKNQYQTTNITIEFGISQADAYNKFREGKMSEVNLLPANVEGYLESDYLFNSPNAETHKLVLNADYKKLQEAQEALGNNVNKVMLSYVDFRQAISLSIDKSEFAQALSPIYTTAYGIVSDAYLTPSQTSYRNELLSKLSLVAIYYPEMTSDYRDMQSPWNPNNFPAYAQLQVPGETYTYTERLNSLYENMTSQNLEKAKELFISAFTDAIANGDYSTDETVVINLVSSQTSPSDRFMSLATMLEGYISSALADTIYAGKIQILTSGSTNENTYIQNLKLGYIDAAIESSASDKFSPLTVIPELYTNNIERDEYYLSSTVTNEIEITLRINGEEETHSLTDWSALLVGSVTYYIPEMIGGESVYVEKVVDYSKASYEIKLLIATAIEHYWMSEYCSITIANGYTSTLLSKQIEYGTSDYTTYLGYGGVRYITYNYTDAEWSTFIKNTNNLLY